MATPKKKRAKKTASAPPEPSADAPVSVPQDKRNRTTASPNLNRPSKAKQASGTAEHQTDRNAKLGAGPEGSRGLGNLEDLRRKLWRGVLTAEKIVKDESNPPELRLRGIHGLVQISQAFRRLVEFIENLEDIEPLEEQIEAASGKTVDVLDTARRQDLLDSIGERDEPLPPVGKPDTSPP